LKVKVHEVGSNMHRVWKVYVMSLVMQTCWNDLGLNLCVMFPISCMVVISENSLVRRGVKYVTINIRDLALTLVNYQASYYVINSLKYIK